MLKIKINNSKDIVKYTDLEIYDINYSGESNEYVVLDTNKHNMRTGDTLRITRKDGEHVFFTEDVKVTVLSETQLLFNAFPLKMLDVSYIEKVLLPTHFDSSKKMQKTECIKINLNSVHDFVHNTDDVIVRDYIEENYYEKPQYEEHRMCEGDIFEMGYLIFSASSITNVDGYKKYVFEKDTYLNNHLWEIFYDYEDEEGENKIVYLGKTDLNSFQDDHEGSGNLIVPSDDYGHDDRFSLLLTINCTDNKDICDYLLNTENITLFYYDQRFFYNGYGWVETDKEANGDDTYGYEAVKGSLNKVITHEGKNYECVPKIRLWRNKNGEFTTTFSRVDSSYNIKFPFVEAFSPDTSKEEVFDTYFIEEKIQKNINPIVDYEKVCFVPMYLDTDEFNENNLDNFKDSWLKPLNRIEYNLHFRKRNYTETTYDGKPIFMTLGIDEKTNQQIIKKDSGTSEPIVDYETTYVYRDYEEWKISDTEQLSNYWNCYDPDEGYRCELYEKNPNVPDLLGDLGFFDDDVYYQKKKLKKSFLRISVYDSINRGIQSLQHYSTMFFDTGKFYKKYINLLSENDKPDIQYVYDEINHKTLDKNRLGATMECCSKYNTEMSSEGFYFYMFPSIITGDTLTPLYIKVEFNNAKFGQTVTLGMPVNSDYEPEVIGNENYNFPLFYYTSEDSPSVLSNVLNDQYIKIYVKYNFETNEYVWFLPRNKQEGVYPYINENNETVGIFNVYEQRINHPSDGAETNRRVI